MAVKELKEQLKDSLKIKIMTSLAYDGAKKKEDETKQSRTLYSMTSLFQVLLDATKPQDGVNGNAEGVHSAEGGDSGRATGSEVDLVSPSTAPCRT